MRVCRCCKFRHVRQPCVPPVCVRRTGRPSPPPFRWGGQGRPPSRNGRSPPSASIGGPVLCPCPLHPFPKISQSPARQCGPFNHHSPPARHSREAVLECFNRGAGIQSWPPGPSNHSPLPGRQTGLEGESANQGRSPRIFRWGDRLFAFTQAESVLIGKGHARPLQLLCNSVAIPLQGRCKGDSGVFSEDFQRVISGCLCVRPVCRLGRRTGRHKHVLECFNREREPSHGLPVLQITPPCLAGRQALRGSRRSRAARRRLMRWGVSSSTLEFSPPAIASRVSRLSVCGVQAGEARPRSGGGDRVVRLHATVGHPRVLQSGVQFFVPVLCTRFRRSAKARPANAAPSTITPPRPVIPAKLVLVCFNRGA